MCWLKNFRQFVICSEKRRILRKCKLIRCFIHNNRIFRKCLMLVIKPNNSVTIPPVLFFMSSNQQREAKFIFLLHKRNLFLDEHDHFTRLFLETRFFESILRLNISENYSNIQNITSRQCVFGLALSFLWCFYTTLFNVCTFHIIYTYPVDIFDEVKEGFYPIISIFCHSFAIFW